MTEEESKAWRPNIPGYSDDILPYYEKIAQWLPAGGKAVEVGLWYGRSALFMVEELTKLNKQVEFHSVDSMMPLPVILHNRLNYMHTTSVDAAATFADNSLDFVFIDADHSYENVKQDINAWLPKVRLGGILAGHDYFQYDTGIPHPGVQTAVDELLVNLFTIAGRTIWEYKKS